MKRSLSLILSLLMILSLFAIVPIGAAEADVADTGKSYDLWLGRTQVTDANKDDILGDGTASFDSNANTLRLNDPTIPDFYYDSKVVCGQDKFSDPIYLRCKIYASRMNLNIIGYYHVPYENLTQQCYGLYLTGGSVTFDGDFEFYGNYCGIYVVGDINIVGGRMKAMCYEDYRSEAASAGISATGKVKITDSIEYVETIGVHAGIAFREFESDSAITADTIADYPHSPCRQGEFNHMYPDGGGFSRWENLNTFFYLDWGGDDFVLTTKPVRYMRFETEYVTRRYKIWLGRMQVTESNKNDILYDGGKAKYDTKSGTLTLNNPTIFGDNPEADSTIYAERELTVKGEYHMTTMEKSWGILATYLTLDGIFTFQGLTGAVKSMGWSITTKPTPKILSAVIEPAGKVIMREGTVYCADGEIAKIVKTGVGYSAVISFDKNGGYGKMDRLAVKKYEFYKLPECTFTPPSNKQFKNWKIGSSYYYPGDSVTVDSDFTAYAQWEDAKSKTVTFSAGYGSGKMEPVILSDDQVWFNIPKCTFTPPKNMEFDCWETVPYDGNHYPDKGGLNVYGDIKLEAQWKRTTNSITVVDCTVTAPEEGELPSYTFSVPENQGYKCYTYNGDEYTNGVMWYNVTDGHFLRSYGTETFKAGKQYLVRLSVVKDGYYDQFDTESLKGFVNGNEGTISYCDSGEAWVDYTFTVPTDGTGSIVSGSFTSYLSDTDTVTIQLLQSDTMKYSTTVTGNTASYSIPGVTNGEYTLRVSKKNHVDRDYTLTVSGDTAQNVKICPKGDTNNDGSVKANDAMAAYRHARGESTITDPYKFACANVAGNDSYIKANDAMQIYRQAQGKHSLF